MAAENPVESLQDEASCSICLDYFKDPVTIGCGHNFCQVCIARCWEGTNKDVSCPQCRECFPQKIFKKNRQLMNFVEIAKKLKGQGKKAGTEHVRGEHEEPLKLFCQEDLKCICVVCDRSRDHRTHSVIPVKEAAQAYKEKVEDNVKALKKEREKLLEFKESGDRKNEEYLKKKQMEKQKLTSDFQQLHQFLEEEEQLALAQLEELDKEILKRQKENVNKLSRKISFLSQMISEMEGKRQQPGTEFLQDIRSTLNRCEKKGKFLQPIIYFPELEKNLNSFCQQRTAVKKTLRIFKDSLSIELLKERSKPLRPDKKVNMTLDPDTANPHLTFSTDHKSVIWERVVQNLPDKPERFDPIPCVLGSEGFISGRHHWEVEIRGHRCWWTLGVALESVRRKAGFNCNPEGGIWAVQRCKGQYWALTSPVTPLLLDQAPRKVRISLDYEEGQVVFHDTDNNTPIFTFKSASFNEEKIFPAFWLWDAGCLLKLCP
ncbi:zinc finger protein RFP [Alligator mississippiensis]|uniref:zinc finger protein RFP n=1 Tax=Alligator mississippiensis TaxID=8496 RepID=UPI002877B78F|nr:zinc finger protein RFP [Alligator mississippiensis]XP_059576302.1 zinc finger protein RFP [Alligator mississippiensis]XP_059576303.1 zinc finger protein RFP [Alligator mississippiensis]